jgi:DNA primase
MKARTEDIVEEIKTKCNIVDVIGRHVTLKKAGSAHKGLCPFHNEKTPSFVVSEERQRFTCFGCGASGDVISFVQRHLNLSFLEAVQKLADECGIQWEPGGFEGESGKSAYYEANREAAVFFYRLFRGGRNPALAYMAARGVDDGTLKKFGVGYADGSWDSLRQHMQGKGFDDKLMEEIGLIALSKGKYYDKFRNRVVFPIINTREKVIGFGGRAIGDGSPKYLNSQDSRIFHKKDNLYALNITRQEISKEGQAILVEGYMDAVSLYQRGVLNVAASLGTALTKEQAAKLKRYTDSVVIAYDSDAAGKAAALRGMDVLSAAGCDVKVLCVEGAKDPDEYIKANGREMFMKLVREAKPMAEFKLDLERGKADMGTVEGSVKFLRAAARILRALSPVEAELYIRKTAMETGISEGAIRGEMQGAAAESPRPAAAGRRAAADSGERGSLLERSLIRLALRSSGYLKRIKEIEHVFATPAIMRIYSSINALYADDDEIDARKLAESLDGADVEALTDIMENIALAGNEESVFNECVKRVKLSGLSDREEEIIQMLTLANEEENKDRIDQLSHELLLIQGQIKEVKGW